MPKLTKREMIERIVSEVTTYDLQTLIDIAIGYETVYYSKQSAKEISKIYTDRFGQEE